MAKFKYKGDHEVDVPALGRVVAPGDSVEVPDELVAVPILDDAGVVVGHEDGPGLVWPEETWSEVTPPKKATARAKAAGDTKGDN